MKLTLSSHILILYFFLSFPESIIFASPFWILVAKFDINTKSDILIFQRILTSVYCSRIHTNQPDCNHCNQKFALDFPCILSLAFFVIPAYDSKTLDRHICCVESAYIGASRNTTSHLMIRTLEMHRYICAMKCLLLWKIALQAGEKASLN